MADCLKPTVAVVGGGWAGLAAAVALVDAGHPVAVYEAARQLGGRARTVTWKGLAIDNGQHLMAGAYTQTLSLVRRLGQLDGLERHPLKLLAPEFRLTLPRLPAPLHLATGLLGARGLSFTDKLAAARFMRRLEHAGFRLPDDPTVADFLHREGQAGRLIRHLWEPICVAALNTPLAEASAQVFCHVLRDSLAGPRAASDMLFNRADLGRLLPEAAAGYLRRRGGLVHLGRRVTGLRPAESGFHLDGVDDHAERVIVATHPARVPALLAAWPEAAARVTPMRAYAWQPIVTLWLRFSAPLAFPYPMLALGHGTAPWAFERNDVTPGLVAIVASAHGPHLDLGQEALRDAWLALLTARFGTLPPLQDWTAITEKRATYSCVPGLPRPPNRTPVAHLYLAGDYTAGDYPATLEGAVRSGVECARLIQETA